MSEYIKLKKTKYKKWDGKHWQYYAKIKCKECGKDTFCGWNSYKTRGYGFCLGSSRCRIDYYEKLKHPKMFNIMDDEYKPYEFYYLVGLIASDGHIRWPNCTKKSDCYRCSIRLNKKDLDILKNIKHVFGGNIYETKSDNCFVWELHNKKFVKYLRDDVNMLQSNKTFTLEVSDWFDTLSIENKWNFMLGVFDGDGSICNIKNGSWVVSIYTASDKFATMINNFLLKYGSKMYKPRKSSCYQINLHGRNILAPLSIMYKNKVMCLDRKYKLFKEYCNYEYI